MLRIAALVRRLFFVIVVVAVVVVVFIFVVGDVGVGVGGVVVPMVDVVAVADAVVIVFYIYFVCSVLCVLLGPRGGRRWRGRGRKQSKRGRCCLFFAWSFRGAARRHRGSRARNSCPPSTADRLHAI